jgi:hypothetical protein
MAQWRHGSACNSKGSLPAAKALSRRSNVRRQTAMDSSNRLQPAKQPDPCAEPCEEEIDQTVEDSFPASDPPSYSIPHRNEGPKAEPETKSGDKARDSAIGGKKWPDLSS